MNNQPLISVVVPVYNVAAYLAQCLKSIAVQTYRNLEILVVDDGSTDKSGRIADEWALHDNRFVVVHQPNGGPAEARNAALDIAKGDYVAFIDSDDLVLENYVERLLETLIAYNADIAICGFVNFREGSLPILDEEKTNEERHVVYNRHEAMLSFFYQKDIDSSPWGRIFKRELFDGVRFPKNRIFEDLAIYYPLLQKVETVVKIEERLYCYRLHSGSIMGRFSMKRADVLDILEDLENRITVENPQYLPAVRSRLLSAAFNMLRLIPLDDAQYMKLSYRSWNLVVRLRNACLRDKNVRTKNKVAIFISYLGQAALLKAINGK